MPKKFKLLYNGTFTPTVFEIEGGNITSKDIMPFFRESEDIYFFRRRDLFPNKVLLFRVAFGRYDYLRIRWFLAAGATLFLCVLHAFSIPKLSVKRRLKLFLSFSSPLGSISWTSFFWNDDEIVASIENLKDYLLPMKFPLLWFITAPLFYLTINYLIRGSREFFKENTAEKGVKSKKAMKA